MSNKIKPYYWAYDELESNDVGAPTFIIVPKDHFDSKGYWDDSFGMHNADLCQKFGESGSSIFEYDGTREEAESYFNSDPNGFINNTALLIKADDIEPSEEVCDDHAYYSETVPCPACAADMEGLGEESEETPTPVVPLTPQEQAQALRDYVASMQKVQGHTSAELRDIIETIHRRMILVINYSGADATVVKSIKSQMKDIVTDELERYKDE